MARVSDAHLEARRQSILDAATRVFAQKGIASATMAEIASVAGISPGAIYRYFENKDDLARGCMNESAESLKNAWSNPEALELSFNELAALTFAGIALPEENIDTQMFLEQMLIAVREGEHAALGQFQDETRRVREGIAFLISREYGEDAVKRMDLERLGEALFAFYWGARLLKLFVPETDPLQQYEQIHTIMSGALKA
ncbi:MAG: helix-turn-helix domain-containing protein [Dehalococcoidia bacterium]|jgi:AcrR family transcriptional regulator